jgi:hypothetical protein
LRNRIVFCSSPEFFTLTQIHPAQLILTSSSLEDLVVVGHVGHLRRRLLLGIGPRGALLDRLHVQRAIPQADGSLRLREALPDALVRREGAGRRVWRRTQRVDLVQVDHVDLDVGQVEGGADLEERSLS